MQIEVDFDFQAIMTRMRWLLTISPAQARWWRRRYFQGKYLAFLRLPTKESMNVTIYRIIPSNPHLFFRPPSFLRRTGSSSLSASSSTGGNADVALLAECDTLPSRWSASCTLPARAASSSSFVLILRACAKKSWASDVGETLARSTLSIARLQQARSNGSSRCGISRTKNGGV